jgi:hypothetical protein
MFHGPTLTEAIVARNAKAEIGKLRGVSGECWGVESRIFNGYTFTATAAAKADWRILADEAHPGFQTPALLFGNGFAGTIADTTIVDI